MAGCGVDGVCDSWGHGVDGVCGSRITSPTVRSVRLLRVLPPHPAPAPSHSSGFVFNMRFCRIKKKKDTKKAVGVCRAFGAGLLVMCKLAKGFVLLLQMNF